MNAIISVAKTPIRQLNGLYSLNDLHRAAGGEDRHSPRRWLQNQQTVDLILEVEKDGNPSILKKQRLGTFACKELVVHYGMWISPEFSLQVIRAFLGQIAEAAQPAAELPSALHPTRDGLDQAIRYLSRRRGLSQQDVERMLYSLFDVTSLDELGQPELLEAVKHTYSYAIFGEQRHRAVDLTVEQVEEFTTLLHHVAQLLRAVDALLPGLEVLKSPMETEVRSECTLLSWLLFRCLAFLSPPDRLDLEELLALAGSRADQSQLLQ